MVIISSSAVTDRSKKSKVLAEEDDPNHGLDSELVMFVEKLQEVQDQLDKVNDEATDKILQVEQKYNVIRKPVFAKRNEIIRNIPDFWLTAFLSHPELSIILNEEDQKIFKYLDSFDVEDFRDVSSGYSITFSFMENPYFENSKLTKTFTFIDGGAASIKGTEINWKEGMDITIAPNNERKGNKRPTADNSFFSWFSENQEHVIFAGHQDDLQVGEVMKEDLWPNPLKYFTNDDEGGSDGDEEEEEKEVDDNEVVGSEWD